MFGFLSFLLILFLLILFIGFSILSNIFRILFGFGRRTNNPNRTYNHTYTSHNDNNADNRESYTETSSSSQRPNDLRPGHKKKIFDDDEGEYVDFEEMK